uniref:Reverse transcriptase domain-containing protein n=1 Tax=Rhabditophanes sp. KR3021 TaxID=114890 RepID=A0AC35UEC5_9BILA
MAKNWKDEELQMAKEIAGAVKKRSAGEYEEIKNLHFPNRTVASVKKKILELQGEKVEASGGVRKKFATWSLDESRKLQTMFMAGEVTKSKTARIEEIKHEFPGRTVKSMQNHLRDNYYATYNGQPEVTKTVAVTTKHNGPTPKGVTSMTTTRTMRSQTREHSTAPTIPATTQTRTRAAKTATHVSSQLRTTRSQSRELSMAPTATPPPSTLRTIAEEDAPIDSTTPTTRISLAAHNEPTSAEDMGPSENVGGKSVVIKEFNRFFNMVLAHPVIKVVDRIVEKKLSELEKSVKNSNRKHELSKMAILAGAYTLRKRIAGRVGALKVMPKYLATEKKIARLEKRSKTAKVIQNGGFKPTKAINEEINEMRKLRMAPNQYIQSCKDRVDLLREELTKQKERHQTNKTRFKFENQPSMKALKGRNADTELNFEEAEEVYKKLYRKKPDTLESPQFDEWLEMFSNEQLTTLPMELSEERLKKMVAECLKTSALWKAPGHDQVPNFAYKTLKSAKKYLTGWIGRNLKNEYELSRKDVKGLCHLIYKDGDANDVLNYRPISLLNTDYKLLTKVLTVIIKENLPANLIPEEQMARENTWGTLHGLLLDKAYSQDARFQKKSHVSAWYDFSKAFDSISHAQIAKLVDALNIDPAIKKMAKSMMGRWNIELIRKDLSTPKEIDIQQGVYQGDSWSPLIFILITAGIIHKVKTNEELGRATGGYRHRIIAFMDDIKVHSPNMEGLNMMTKMIEGGAAELGLKLNRRKCGHFARNRVEAEGNGDGDEESQFLPEVKRGYKYLGIIQLERDDAEGNFEKMSAKYLERTQTILESCLTINQKRRLYNTAVIPAGIYVTGNLFPEERVASTLLRCRRIDLEVRKMAVVHNIKTRPTANARFYLPNKYGGLAFRSLEVETCIQYIRRYVYLMSKDEVKEAKRIYMAMDKKGWRNPISDFKHVAKKYGLTDLKLEKKKDIDFRAVCKDLIEEVKKADLEAKKDDWSKAMTYPKLVLSLEDTISFPAMKSVNLDSSKLSLINASAEEQVFFKGKKMSTGVGTDGKCRFGCGVDETNYHVTSACRRSALITRHDMVVWNILKLLRRKFGPPEKGPPKSLQVGQAALDEDYANFKIRAGAPMLMDKKIKSNKPDIVIFRKEPKLAVVLEVSIPALKNYNLQKDIKLTKYTKNSVLDINMDNVRTVTRDQNFCEILEATHHCRALFCPVIIGTYGEFLESENAGLYKIFGELGVTEKEVERLKETLCLSVITSTTRMILKHLKAPETD